VPGALRRWADLSEAGSQPGLEGKLPTHPEVVAMPLTTPAGPSIDAVRDREWRLRIGGELSGSRGGERYPSIDPSTEETIAEVPDASAKDVDMAVRTAREAGERWRRVAVRERAAIVRRLVPVLLEHRDELAFLDALDGGSPITAMRGDVQWAVDNIELFCDWAMELRGQTIPASAENLHYTVLEPYGVVARIIPYNHPLFFTAAKIAAPLVAGNAVVLMAPDQTPLSPLRIGELFADVLPSGLLTVLSGTKGRAGEALVRHPDVRRIAFIGSERTGRTIQRTAAETGVKHVTLELGGKNAMVVFPDADIVRVAASAVAGMNFTASQGQSCGSTSRLLLHESIAGDVVDAVRATVEQIRIGSPLDDATQMGPVISRAHYDRILGFVESARTEGARVVTGGNRAPGFDRGFFLSPTVLDGVQPGMRVAREEIFGPVLSVMTWRDEAEAIRIANGVDYGLTASVWTNDITRAHRVVRELEAGYVWINGVSRHFWGTPFGGVKSSGVGREEDVEELRSYAQVKTVHVLL